MPVVWIRILIGTTVVQIRILIGTTVVRIRILIGTTVVRIASVTGISRDPEICPGFPPPQAALVTVASGGKGLWVVWFNSGEVMLTLKALGVFSPDSRYWLSIFSDSVQNRYFSTEHIVCQSQFWV